MKRFYTSASVADDNGILLDGRPVLTPRKTRLTVPTRRLAEAICEEWLAQTETIRPQSMPLTGLANAAIDVVMPDTEGFAGPIAAYADCDLLYYRDDSQPALVQRQQQQWEPLLDWATRRFDIEFVRVNGVMHRAQPDDTVTRLASALRTRSPHALAAMSQLVTISGSLIIGLALHEGLIAAEDGFALGHLDELYQAEQWGEDWMAAEARALRRNDFLSAARYLALLDGR